MHHDHWKITCFVILITLLIVVSVFFREEIKGFLSFIESDQTHPSVLFLSFLILPVLGFPITVLLILLGLRFDSLWGILIMFMLVPFHLALSFWGVHSFFGSQLKTFAEKKHYPIFNVRESKYAEFSFLFMAIPGLPYAVKNYLLPLFGIPFRYYFFIGWAIHGITGIPFVILGDVATEYNFRIILFFLPLFLLIFFIKQKIKKRYKLMVKSAIEKM